MKNWKSRHILIPMAIAAAVFAVSIDSQAQMSTYYTYCKFPQSGDVIKVRGHFCPSGSAPIGGGME